MICSKPHQTPVKALPLVSACPTLSILGLIVAAVTYLERASGICGIGGCAEVFYSEYSELLGIPLELWAAAWFSSIAALSTARLLGIKRVTPIITALIAVGLVSIPPLVYIELFVIGSICAYCTAMHVLIATIAVTWFLTIRRLGGDTGRTGLPQA